MGQYPYLKHAVLTVTMMHDRTMLSPSGIDPSAVEALHSHLSTELLQNKLSGKADRSEYAAIVLASAMLAYVTFCNVEAKTPEEAWPLKPQSPSDLQWLKMSYGKNDVRRTMQDPTKDDAILQKLDNGPVKEPLGISLTAAELQNVPAQFIKLYGLDSTPGSDATPSAETNPYQAGASIFAWTLNLDSNISTILNFLSFTVHMHPEYKRLLEGKDPRALLLMACWYAKICQYQHWWLRRRANLECQAICLYLERYHTDETDIQKLLWFPKWLYGIGTEAETTRSN